MCTTVDLNDCWLLCMACSDFFQNWRQRHLTAYSTTSLDSIASALIMLRAQARPNRLRVDLRDSVVDRVISPSGYVNLYERCHVHRSVLLGVRFCMVCSLVQYAWVNSLVGFSVAQLEIPPKLSIDRVYAFATIVVVHNIALIVPATSDQLALSGAAQSLT